MANNYRSARQRAVLSLDEAAAGIGVGPDTLQAWEDGTSEPFGDDLCRMAELYGCSPDYLLGMAEQR